MARDAPVFVEGPLHFALPPERVRAALRSELELRQAQCLDLDTGLWSASSTWSPPLHAQTTQVPRNVDRIRALPGDQWLVAHHGRLAIAERCVVTPLTDEKRKLLETELEESLTLSPDGPTIVVDLSAGGIMRLDDPEQFWPLRDPEKRAALSFFCLGGLEKSPVGRWASALVNWCCSRITSSPQRITPRPSSSRRR